MLVFVFIIVQWKTPTQDEGIVLPLTYLKTLVWFDRQFLIFNS